MSSSLLSARAQGSGPPAEAFFSDASVQEMQISPSGRYLATIVLAPDGKGTRVVVSDLQDKEPDRAVAAFSRARASSLLWVSDELLIFEAGEDRDRSVRVSGRSLMTVRRNGEGLRVIIAANDFSQSTSSTKALNFSHFFIQMGAAGSDEIIVGETLYDAAYEVKAVRPLALNVRTGARRSVTPSEPPSAKRWLFDPQGRPRLAVSIDGDKGAYHWLDLKNQTWKELARFTPLKAPYAPEFVAGDDTLFVSVAGADGDELRRFDMQTGQPETDAMVATPGFSSSMERVTERDSGELLGLRLLTDARVNVWLTPALQGLQAKVDAALPGRVNVMQCSACDRLDVLPVFSYSDRAPGDFLLYRRKEDKWQRLGSQHPKIEAGAMSPLQFHRIRARDGADLPLWVTLPSGDKRPRAAVVMVHGGPWVRGRDWAWDAEGQFLASRGYVVIEPEFRGSMGYGDRHFRAGFKQWGQAMQDDVTDALRFAVKQGWVDEKRVCILGGSYGGYATLMGLAKDPSQYRCGVASFAVSDPMLMFTVHWSDISSQAKNYSYKETIGDPVADAAMLAANSPLAQAARIKAPVLLAYGGRDRRVPIVHGERMRDALTKAGNPPEWVVYDDEYHGFRFEETRVDFWKRTETFLGKHLAP
ncbi:MAG: prolyl oligopeptidase family serine peptidase [Rubrivivax sp.]|nr:prolyl oligopeptidase family serine peptidase [Rubrivivax sp.]